MRRPQDHPRLRGENQLTGRGEVTDRFTKALERFGSPEVYVRIGGILALEQIIQDAPEQATTPRTSSGTSSATAHPRPLGPPEMKAATGPKTCRPGRPQTSRPH